jgi:soluble lytic murein transglycosylase-like protein
LKIPRREEYFFHNGAFILKSPWVKRFKAILATIIASLVIVPTEITTAAPIVFNKFFQKSTEQKLIDYVMSVNESVSKSDAWKIVSSVMKYSNQFDIKPELMLALGKVESSYDKHAISGAGAVGIFQIMPQWHFNKMKTAKTNVGTPEPFSIETNTYIGMWVLRDCIDKWKNISGALLCYNGSNAKPNGYDTKVLETMNEIRKIL